MNTFYTAYRLYFKGAAFGRGFSGLPEQSEGCVDGRVMDAASVGVA
ncbi:hypothetical protein [Methanooceanicella nereidis]|nr:hypothetical protein [Methanocella sp. CWC-04]